MLKYRIDIKNMDLKIGDQVRYLNAVGGGVVIGIVDSKTVKISDDIGFEIPVLASELVKIEGNTPQSAPKKKVAEPEKEVIPEVEPEVGFEQEIPGNDFPDLILALLQPEGKGDDEEYRVYLINDCNYHFTYQIATHENELLHHVDMGTLEANTKVFVGSYTAREIQKGNGFFIQGFFFKTKAAEQVPPVQKDINISPVKLFKKGSFKTNDFFDQKALTVNIIEQDMKTVFEKITPEEIDSAIKQKESARKAPVTTKKQNKDNRNFVKEVDLHIHELVETETGLTPTDKLNIQIQHFEKELDDAIAKGIRKIVFIHGVGNGVLKLRIRSILDKDYKRYQYQDASFQQYKYGATLVSLL